ncbi:hypothetical protein Q5P01_019301 [Channa striata]|uniref:Uncharacterized protein n=1 Tax=Channa striata TaxID=64152 RepID=A0AA88S6U9_CHASR|nr:hypothetical protein Q5P01_019301 [Channa striata]
MFFFYIIITALPTAFLTKGVFECKLSQTTAAQQCTGALGKPLRFFLPTNTTEKKNLKKNKDIIFRMLNNNTVDVNKEYSNRSASFTNGTFQINMITQMDSGDYQLETYNSDGTSSQTIHFHLEVLAPVSQPTVSQMCLSPEQMSVSCSSKGDRLEFIVTLDDNVLIQTDKRRSPNVTINLYGQLTGNMMCRVQNNVSREDTVIQLTACKDSISHPSLVTVAVISTAATLLVFLVFILGIILTAYKAEDEVVYSDVRLKPTKKTKASTNQATSFRIMNTT